MNSTCILFTLAVTGQATMIFGVKKAPPAKHKKVVVHYAIKASLPEIDIDAPIEAAPASCIPVATIEAIKLKNRLIFVDMQIEMQYDKKILLLL